MMPWEFWGHRRARGRERSAFWVPSSPPRSGGVTSRRLAGCGFPPPRGEHRLTRTDTDEHGRAGRRQTPHSTRSAFWVGRQGRDSGFGVAQRRSYKLREARSGPCNSRSKSANREPWWPLVAP